MSKQPWADPLDTAMPPAPERNGQPAPAEPERISADDQAWVESLTREADVNQRVAQRIASLISSHISARYRLQAGDRVEDDRVIHRVPQGG